MVKESSLETTPGLIALIDNPTEEDLLRVIYSDKVTSDVIKELPDKSITPRVATIALCLDKRWRDRDELTLWFDKFLPYINRKDYLKVFINIEDKLPDSFYSFHQKDWDLFIKLFSKITNPPTSLVDFYLKTCIEYNLFGIFEYKYKLSGYTKRFYELNARGLTRNLKDALDNNQTSLIYTHFLSKDIITHSIYYDPSVSTLIVTNKQELGKLSSFLRKEDYEEISIELDELNKPIFEQNKKQESIGISKETTNPSTKVSLWERFLQVFK